MIARHWTALCRKDKAFSYIAHLQEETIPQLKLIEGFESVFIHHREKTDAIEFLVITTWLSHDSIRQFTGDDIRLAVVPDHIRAWMLEYDTCATHYKVIQ